MKLRATLFLALLVAVFSTAPADAHAQPVASIAVTGPSGNSLSLTAADLALMPRVTTSTSSNGIETLYEGVALSEVLKKAGVPFGSAMRGAALTGYVLASASDGYQVLFSLGEIDPDLTDNQYVLADKANGKAMFGETGAFRLVVPKDKRGARSVRMLSSLTVVQIRK